MLPLLIVIALLNAFLAGFHGSAAVVATVISSRALSPRAALVCSALAAFIGPLVLGTAVANTISQQLISPSVLTPDVLVCGLLAAVSWVLFTWWMGVPSSASHALIGGLLGAAFAAAGPLAIQPLGLIKTIIGLFASPPLGWLAGLLVMPVILFFVQNATPRINLVFRRFQLFSTIGLAATIGSNDAQKFMGLIALALLLSGASTTFAVPGWAIVASAAAFALGTLSGGYRLIRTLGGRIFKVRPVHSLGAQLAAGGLILTASLTGLPVSGTHVMSTAIFGVGSAERLSKVRWQVAGDLLTAWALTLPLTALLAGAGYWLLKGLTL